MPEYPVIVRVSFTDTDALGRTGWRRVAIEIDNQAGEDQPALIAAAAAFYDVPVDQVRVEQKTTTIADRGLHREDDDEDAVPAIVIGGVHAR